MELAKSINKRKGTQRIAAAYASRKLHRSKIQVCSWDRCILMTDVVQTKQKYKSHAIRYMCKQ